MPYGERLARVVGEQQLIGVVAHLEQGELVTYFQPEVRRVIANGVRWAHGTGYRRDKPYGDPGLNAPSGWYERLAAPPAG